MGIAKDRNRQVPSRTLGLSCRAKGLDQEPRHVSPKPNPEPCDGHKGHKLNDASAELDHLARREQGRGARRGCLSSVSVAAPAVVAGVPSARTSGERAGRLNADRQGTAALLESAVTRLSGATVSSSVGSNCIAARGNRALTLNAILTVVFLPLRNISDLDSDRFALRQAAAARDDHAQVMEELELVVREHLARLPTRREQAFTPFG